jgi:hypothetical protein
MELGGSDWLLCFGWSGWGREKDLGHGWMDLYIHIYIYRETLVYSAESEYQVPPSVVVVVAGSCGPNTNLASHRASRELYRNLPATGNICSQSASPRAVLCRDGGGGGGGDSCYVLLP